MKRTKFQKIIALLLTFVLLVGGSATTASAASGTNDSVTDVTIESMKDLLDVVSYDEYCNKYYEKNSEGEVVTDNGKPDGNPVWSIPRAEKDIYIDATDYDAENTNASVSVGTYGGQTGLYLPDSGSVTWNVEVPADGRYTLLIEYYAVEAKNAAVGRILKINDEIPFSEARYLTMSKAYSNAYGEESRYTFTDKNGEHVRYFNVDIYGNEIRTTSAQAPEWREYHFKDADGFSTYPFEIVFKEGQNSITLQAESEPVVIKSITLCAPEDRQSYADYLEENKDKPVGTGKVTIEAEMPVATSSQTVYAIEDRTSPVNRPTSTEVQLLNTIGGDKWQIAGQWIRYELKVDASGMYEIAARFKQNVNDGMYSSRTLYIYSVGLEEGDDGYYNGVPFEEAAQLSFGYSDEWQSDVIGYYDDNHNHHALSFYFEEGVTYYLEFEVTLGDMGEIVSRVQASLEAINQAYLDIIKLTGTSPDNYRDYGFYRIMPETMVQMVIQSWELEEVAKLLEEITGEKGSNSSTLVKVAQLLDEMATDEDEVARNLDRLKSYIGTLGTWLSTSKTQPLQLDYLVVQGAGLAEQDSKTNLPKADGNFWQKFTHEISSFIQSFFRDYNHMGAIEEITNEEETVEVWLAYGRDQSQVIRNLINNYFTPETGVTVDLKLVAGGTLLPSILAKTGPDCYIGIGQGDIINYAIRGAVMPVEDCEGFEEFALNPETREFNDAAMQVLGIADAAGEYHYYGLPETQAFEMMFVRTDILANLDLEIPRTWDDLLESLPTLQANNMEIGLTTETNMYIYQRSGTLFADDGMRINLDSNVALEAFNYMCNLFTMYSFPYKFDTSNRFRTGEMPIVIGSYTGIYNTLVVFATEIRGSWQFFPLPGIEDENGNINNCSVSTNTAIAMINGCSNIEDTWTFMKWHSGEQCQAMYANEMVAILGDSAKHATANIKAIDDLTWTQDELVEIQKQMNNLASVPNYPGAYIVSRYTNFAFLAAYNDMADPAESLLSYINTINKEISRKRAEFDLETLEVGDTLGQKRMREALYLTVKALGLEESREDDESKKIEETMEILKGIDPSAPYASEVKALVTIADEIINGSVKSGVDQEILNSINAAMAGLKSANAEKFADAIAKCEQSVTALDSYNVK